MFYEGLNLIFVHQRKCAGQSIRAALGPLPAELDGMYQDGVLSPEWDDRVRNHLKIAVIRNPWDRFVSGWRYCRSTRQRSILQALENLPRRGHDYRHVTRQQTETIFGADGRISVDFVLRFECLQADFDALCKMLGKDPEPLPHANKGSGETRYSDLFGPQERELFAKHFANDVRSLGYSFDRPGCPPAQGAIGRRHFLGPLQLFLCRYGLLGPAASRARQRYGEDRAVRP